VQLRTKLLVPLLVLPLGSVALLGAVAYSNGRDALETSLGRLFEVAATRSLSALDHELLSLYGDAESWATLDRMQDVLQEDMDGRISSFLVARVRDEPRLQRAVVADASGRVIAASRRQWLGGVLRPPPPGAAPREACRDDPAAGPGVLACSFPIRAHFDEGLTLGTLEVAWDVAAVFARVQAENQSTSRAPHLILMRRDGVVVSAPPAPFPAGVGESLAAAGSRAASLAAEGRQGFLVEPIGGVPHLAGYARSAGVTGWSIVVLETTAVAFAPVDRLRGAVLALGGTVALAAVLLSFLLSGRLTSSVRELDAAARQVAAGDLSVRLEPRSRDEIGSLTRSFDQMVRELARHKAELVDKRYVDSLVADMSDGLFVVDSAGRIERANPAFLRRVSLAAADVVGRPAGALFAEGDEAFERRVRGPTRRDGAAMAELTLRGRDGVLVPVIVSGGVLPEGGLVCVATDITQRKEAEEQLRRARHAAEEAAAAKARFLAVVSHEVRTPLNGVIGMTDLLAGTALDDKQREYVEVARRSGESLMSLLGDILDYSRKEAGRVELARVAFDLRKCLFDCADLLTPPAGEKGLEVSALADDRLPLRVVGDPQRVRQVLLNLGSNAVKFTAAGGVVLRAEPSPSAAAAVRFSVSDSGPGIPPEHLSRIFEPFHQVDASSTRRHGGVGLGLAIVRQIVGLMGGTIEARNDEGGGATFTFTADLPGVAEEAAPAGADPTSLAERRVLVVDDNPTNRLVLREMLAVWRCRVVEATDAWAALDALRERADGPEAIELALVDFQMPEMDGAALAREIKADPRLRDVPLVLLTSIPQHPAEPALASAFVECLTKPVRQAALLEAMAAALSPRLSRRPNPRVSVFRPRRGPQG
jgi:PAS domain S-box-containing protein